VEIRNEFLKMEMAKELEMESELELDEQVVYAQFTGEGGYEVERVKARDVFELGKSYRVRGGVESPEMTYLEIEEVPGSWNSVLFECDLSGFPLRKPDCQDSSEVEFQEEAPLDFPDRDRDSSLEVARVFQHIFTHRIWGTSPISGSGSMDSNTENLRSEFRATVDRLGIKSIFDGPCGDWTWMSQIDLQGIDYHGVDIVPDLVKSCRESYSRDGVQFSVRDITSRPFPRVDLILIRDCLVHLSSDLVKKTIRLARMSDSRYLATTFFPGAENTEIKNGEWRPLDPTRQPFYLKNLACHIPENESGKFLGFWEINPPDKR